ncbi:serine protease [Verrucomicrobiales bacterium]|nr:serine protease [Verrucomicrobiales bacterium]
MTPTRTLTVFLFLFVTGFACYAQQPSASGSTTWRPTSIQDVMDCTLLVEIDGRSAGTAFLCNENGISYVVTNVHVVHAARSIKFIDSEGNEYGDISYCEVPAKPWGKWIKSKDRIEGGDLVRFRLREYRPRGLVLRPGTDPPAVGESIIIAGNKNGAGKVVVAEGKIHDVKEQIILHDAPSAGGNSGSAIVAHDNFDVIAIETWGPQRVHADQFVWRDGIRIEEGGGIGWGAGFFVTPRWIRLPVGDLLAEAYRLEEFKRKIRVLGLLDITVPTVDGLFISEEKEVKYGKTVGSILAEGAENDTIRYLVGLHDKLEQNRESKIRMSLQDVYKNYMAALKYAWQDTVQDREIIESRGMPFFYECVYFNSKVLLVSRIYEDSMNSAYTWYDDQLSVGSTIILGDRPRLPSLDAEVWKQILGYDESQ